MLIAGAAAGGRYQSVQFFDAVGVATLGFLMAFVLYAVLARRFRLLIFLPIIAISVVAQELLAALFFVVGIIGVPIGVLFSAFRPTRQNWLVVTQLAITGIAAVLSIFLYAQLQKTGARRATQQGEVIVEAIRAYEVKTGELPASLDELVPRELESIPETGMGGFPSFEYIFKTAEADESEHIFSSYELRVNLFKLVQFDCLVYWPEGNYPDSMYGGGVERIGDWAYVHE
jgi:hypothetical protein